MYVLVVVSWTRLRHQHLLRRTCGVRAHDSPVMCSKCRECKKRIYEEGVYSGRDGQRREVVPPVCPCARECG